MPEFEVRFHPDAVEEAEAAKLWYAERSRMAALGFVNELSHAVEKVAESPNRWPVYENKTRRYIFPRYPFSLVYRLKQDIIEIIAIAHHKKKPGYWTDE